MVFFILQALLAICWLQVPTSADLTWTAITPSTLASPVGTFAAAIVHDALNNRLVLYGGRAPNRTILDETWQFSFDSSSWSEITVTTKPPPRHTFTWGLHTSTNRFVIATGQGINTHYNDIWAFDLNNNTWQQLPGNGDVPHGRYGSGGGIYPGSNSFWITHGFASKRYSDTYEYDLVGLRWYKRSPGTNSYNPDKPHSRCLVASALASPYELVMYGGCMQGGQTGGPCPAKDGWIYETSSASWRSIDQKPSPRTWGSMARAPNLPNHIVLYGGMEEGKQTITVDHSLSSEVAVLDVRSGSWFLAETKGDIPEKRHGAAVTTATNGTAVYMFGGVGLNGTGLQQLYSLGGDAYSSPENPDSYGFFLYPHLHGLFMTLAWGFFLQAGWFVARYCKGAGPIWFKFHRACQCFGLMLSIVGFILVFVGGAKEPGFAHGIIGIIVFALGLLQPINAFFRPHPGQKYRRQWEWLHLWSGRFALVLALVNISLGLFLILAPKGVWIAWFVWLGIYVVLIVFPTEVYHQWKLWKAPPAKPEDKALTPLTADASGHVSSSTSDRHQQ